MKLLKLFVFGLLSLLMLAMVAIYLTPLDVYVPEVEQALGNQLHEPVSVRHLRLAALPIPHLELQGVLLGGREGIAVKSVDIEFDLISLLTGKTTVRRIVLKDGMAHFVLVRKMLDLFANTPSTAQSVLVRELQLSGMSLVTHEMTLGPIEGKLEFTRSGQLERAWFAANEQKVTATLLPQPMRDGPQPERTFALQVQARDWVTPQFPEFPLDDLQLVGVLGEQDFIAQKVVVASRGIRLAGFGKVEFTDGWRVRAILTRMEAPLERLQALTGATVALTGAMSATGEFSASATNLSALKDNFQLTGDVSVSHATAHLAEGLRHPLLFDEIKVHVAAQPERLELSALEARLYGGRLSGMASINRKDAILSAEIAANRIAMQPVVQALTNKVLFTGSMESAAKFSMRLDAFEQFPGNMQLAGNFHLSNGVLTNVDLLHAASNPGKVNAMGGGTRFDDLTGLLGVDAAGYHFRKLKIISGSLNAEGKVDVSPALQLNGMLDVSVKRTIGLASMPMAVSGTLDNPIVSPSKSALAGAAVGTAILGPGLGTAAGIRIGGFLNKLLGKNSDKNSNKNVSPTHPQ